MPGKAMDSRRDDDMKGNVFIGVVAPAGAAVLGQRRDHLVTGGLETKDLACVGIALLTPLVGRRAVSLPPVAALAVSPYVLTPALVSGVGALKEHQSVVAIWQESSPWAGTAYLAGSVAAAIVFLVVRELGIVSAFAILPFPGILYLSYRACLDRLVRTKGGMTL